MTGLASDSFRCGIAGSVVAPSFEAAFVFRR